MPMKMMYGGVPIKSLNVKHYEVSTSDATAQSSDLQAGVTCYARGQKVTGTGKCFEFANYGSINTNLPLIIPNTINVIEITSTTHPVKSAFILSEVKNVDFTVPQIIGYVVADNLESPVTVTISSGMLTFSCDKSVTLEFFIGKDNYV